MQGSSWPAAADTFATLNEGTTAFSASLLMEIALAMEALELSIGANPYDFRVTHGFASEFTDFAEALKQRMRWEVGSLSFTGGNNSVAVSFAHARFGAAPKVVVQRYGASTPLVIQCYEVGNITTTGFDCFRHDSTGAENCRYLAIQEPQ